MHSIFISYRRADAAGHAGRLADRLTSAFGREHVFIDVDSISYGEDFVEAIQRTLQDCEVVLVLIGPHWLVASDAEGSRRLDSPTDTVVLEIATALEMQRKVLPVLVGGASMPVPESLPEAIRKLARRHAIEVSDKRFGKDALELIEILRGMLERARAAEVPTQPTPAAAQPVRSLPAEPSFQPESDVRSGRVNWLDSLIWAIFAAGIVIAVLMVGAWYQSPSSQGDPASGDAVPAQNPQHPTQ